MTTSSNKRSPWFYGLIIFMLILVVSLALRGRQLLNNEERLLEIGYMADWLPWMIIITSIISIIGIFLIYFYRKIGVYIVVGGLILQIVLQTIGVKDPEDEGLIYTVFPLFVFVGYGLAIIIPIWDRFK